MKGLWNISGYIDPDGIKLDRKTGLFVYNNINFYKNCALCLNLRIGKINPNIEISFDNDGKFPGLIWKNSLNGKVFYLKSDQFGFSAPGFKSENPYDSYINLSGDKESARKSVSEWVNNTRVVGGSFFWPIGTNEKEVSLNPQYNLIRGRGYIEDRADLTLWEIKDTIESYKNNVRPSCKNYLYSRCEKELVLREWMQEFDSFDDYIKYFSFDSFVGKNRIPRNIMDMERKEISLEDREKIQNTGNKNYPLSKLNRPEEYKVVFENLEAMIKERNQELLNIAES